jgi:hypothetical protein
MTPLPFLFYFSGGPLDGNTLAGDVNHTPTLAGFSSIAYRDTQGGRVGSALDVVYPSSDSFRADSIVRFQLHRYVVSHRTESFDGKLEIHVQYFGPMDSELDAGREMLEDPEPRPKKTASRRKARP